MDWRNLKEAIERLTSVDEQHEYAMQPRTNLITTKQVSEILGLSRTTIDSYTREGRLIPALCPSKRKRYYELDHIISFKNKRAEWLCLCGTKSKKKVIIKSHRRILKPVDTPRGNGRSMTKYQKEAVDYIFDAWGKSIGEVVAKVLA